MPTNCEDTWMVGGTPVSAAYYKGEQVYPCGDVPEAPENLTDEFSGWVGVGAAYCKLMGTWTYDDGRPDKAKFYRFQIPNYSQHNAQQFYTEWVAKNPTTNAVTEGAYRGTTTGTSTMPQDQAVWEALNGPIPLGSYFADANPEATYIDPKGLKPQYIQRMTNFQYDPNTTLVFFYYNRNSVDTDFVMPADITTYADTFVYAFWEGEGATAFDVSYEQTAPDKVLFTLTSNTDQTLEITASLRNPFILEDNGTTQIEMFGVSAGTYRVRFEGRYKDGVLAHIWEEDVVVSG